MNRRRLSDDLAAARRVVFKDNLTRSTLQVRDVAASRLQEEA